MHEKQTLKLEFKPIISISDIPSKIAVHGTTRSAWNIIEKEGLSKMKRNHIHLAQGVGGDSVISGA
jgi:2'-phosphotransferase